MEIPLQQTKNWQNLLKSQNETTFFEQKNDYTMLIVEKTRKIGGTYFYLPYGPYARTKNAAKAALERLEALAQQKNVTFIRIEPQNTENASEWLKTSKIIKKVKKSKDLSHKETWVLDITPEMSALYQNMKQNTRNLCKNYAKKGIRVEKYQFDPKNPADSAAKIQILADLQKQVAKNHNFTAFSEKYLKTEFEQPFATLYIAYYDPKLDPSSEKIAKKAFPLAASLFFDHESTRFYMQSASDYRYRKLPATYAIINEAIKDAKAKKLKNFDFWGIAPDGAPKTHPWAGFTSFKKSFGGTEKHYSGTYDLILKPAKYQLYQKARTLNRTIRKIRR
ncbi:peptidoglycan bridge formation glycyltransferase FemA/FemB family protein [Candidatus Saccharibacteria bacterium]|nr:peptidoglycan bridge formation glycyltransferase FemA/FemB family protein [Candidatus Saccharibacteria bacterium]